MFPLSLPFSCLSSQLSPKLSLVPSSLWATWDGFAVISEPEPKVFQLSYAYRNVPKRCFLGRTWKFSCKQRYQKHVIILFLCFPDDDNNVFKWQSIAVLQSRGLGVTPAGWPCGCGALSWGFAEGMGLKPPWGCPGQSICQWIWEENKSSLCSSRGPGWLQPPLPTGLQLGSQLLFLWSCVMNVGFQLCLGKFQTSALRSTFRKHPRVGLR